MQVWKKKARTNGLTKKVTRKLAENVKENLSVFRILLGSDGLAKLTPMKISLDELQKLVKVKVCKYRAD